MSRLVKRQVICLQLLNRTHNAELRKDILEYADAELISALCEFAHNILRGTIRLTPLNIVTEGWFPTNIVSSFGVECIYTFASSTSRLDGACEEDGVA